MKEVKLVVEGPERTREEMVNLFGEEIEEFSKYMATIGDWKEVGALNSLERGLILSYLVHKFRGHIT